MAFTATINTITRTSDSVEVDVTYVDEASGFSQFRSFTFPSDSTTTEDAVFTEVARVGTELKKSLATLNSLQETVGTVIEI